MPADGDEPELLQPAGDDLRVVPVEVEQLDALVAERRDLAQRRLEVRAPQASRTE